MKKIRFAIFFVTVSVLLSLAVQCPAAGPERDAENAGREWLLLVDRTNYALSWDTASAYFQKSMGKPQWVMLLDGVRAPFGETVSRSLLSSKYSKSLPGAPDGNYVVIQYKTVFSGKADSMETLTMSQESDGRWKMAGYFIR